jgi:prepilin-type processing-associated H-X9-DG protein
MGSVQSASSWPRGRYWAWGVPSVTGFMTILPPNSANCWTNPGCGGWFTCGGVFSAQSYHRGGVNVCMADGSGRFIANTIDTGNLTVTASGTAASPYGVWGALGTRASGEVNLAF